MALEHDCERRCENLQGRLSKFSKRHLGAAEH